jgi:uncharacterized protein (TIGR04255 family)
VALQEVVLEIRFPPIEDYAIFAGAMSVSHKVNFPLTKKLEPPGLPEFVPISGIVRHRFSGQDQSKLFQIGSDVISVNYLQYTNFSDFIDDIKEILSSAQTHGAKISYAYRIGLRYINSFNKIADPFELLNRVLSSKHKKGVLAQIDSLDIPLKKSITKPVDLIAASTFDKFLSHMCKQS